MWSRDEQIDTALLIYWYKPLILHHFQMFSVHLFNVCAKTPMTYSGLLCHTHIHFYIKLREMERMADRKLSLMWFYFSPVEKKKKSLERKKYENLTPSKSLAHFLRPSSVLSTRCWAVMIYIPLVCKYFERGDVSSRMWRELSSEHCLILQKSFYESLCFDPHSWLLCTVIYNGV